MTVLKCFLTLKETYTFLECKEALKDSIGISVLSLSVPFPNEFLVLLSSFVRKYVYYLDDDDDHNMMMF